MTRVLYCEKEGRFVWCEARAGGFGTNGNGRKTLHLGAVRAFGLTDPDAISGTNCILCAI